jgi:hypothetical protein
MTSAGRYTIYCPYIWPPFTIAISIAIATTAVAGPVAALARKGQVRV